MTKKPYGVYSVFTDVGMVYATWTEKATMEATLADGAFPHIIENTAENVYRQLTELGFTKKDGTHWWVPKEDETMSSTASEVKEYPQRNIEIGGRTVRCQVLNWNEGPPPRYIVCNALSSNDGIFFAEQRMGAWCKASERDVWFDFATMHKTITDIQTLLVDESLEPKDALDKIKAEVAAVVVLARLK